MSDSIIKLRRVVNELQARIRELEARPAPEPIVEVREVIKEIPGPERVVEKLVPFEVYFPIEKEVYVEKPVIQIKEVEKLVPVEVEKIVYRDVPVEVVREIPGSERIVEKTVTEYIEREVEVLVPFEVEKVVYRDVIKEVEVKVPQYPPSVQRIETERIVYQDNPDHIETIRRLQERLCQYTSQSDL